MITLRLDKGSPLTTEEMDNNLIDLSNRVDLSTDQTISGKIIFSSSPIVLGAIIDSQSLCTSKYLKDNFKPNVVTSNTIPINIMTNPDNLTAIIYVGKTIKKVLTFNNGSWLKFIQPTSLYPSRYSSYIFQNGRLYGAGYNERNSLSTSTTVNFTSFFDLGIDNIKKVYGNSYARSIIIEKNDGTIWSCGYTYPNNGFMQPIADFDNPVNVYCGYRGLFVEKSDGTFWGCGNNNYGQYGTGNSNDCYTPVHLPIDPPSAISLGSRHTIIEKSDGTVWTTGNNSVGQLGLGDNSNRASFEQIPGILNPNKISCGYQHTIIEKSDGTVWATGQNGSGQLGLGDQVDRTSFEQIPEILNPNKIACGYHASFIEKSDGTVWATGANWNGQLGLGDFIDRNIFTQIPGILNPSKIACGYGTLFIEKHDGTVMACGYVGDGELGTSESGVRNFLEILI
jgi:alpha-tubulin suppressor-like RCC1 family protein